MSRALVGTSRATTIAYDRTSGTYAPKPETLSPQTLLGSPSLVGPMKLPKPESQTRFGVEGFGFRV